MRHDSIDILIRLLVVTFAVIIGIIASCLLASCNNPIETEEEPQPQTECVGGT